MEDLIKNSHIFNSSNEDSSLKGTLAFHPLFIQIVEEILDALCEDCKIKVKSRFNQYLKDATFGEENLEQLDPQLDPNVDPQIVPAREHPDLIAFLEAREEVVWEENKHLECYAMSWSRLRFLRG